MRGFDYEKVQEFEGKLEELFLDKIANTFFPGNNFGISFSPDLDPCEYSLDNSGGEDDNHSFCVIVRPSPENAERFNNLINNSYNDISKELNRLIANTEFTNPSVLGGDQDTFVLHFEVYN